MDRVLVVRHLTALLMALLMLLAKSPSLIPGNALMEEHFMQLLADPVALHVIILTQLELM